jgi:hypothetical protein
MTKPVLSRPPRILPSHKQLSIYNRRVFDQQMSVECPLYHPRKRTSVERVSIEEQDACSIVRDYGAQALAYVYVRASPAGVGGKDAHERGGAKDRCEFREAA